jgi:hypothetical protein
MNCTHNFNCHMGEKGADCQELIIACSHYIFLEVNPAYLAVLSATNAAYLENVSCGAKVTQVIRNLIIFPTSWIAVFCDATPCSPLKDNLLCSDYYLLHADFLLGLFFDPEDRDSMFLRNINWLSNGLHGVISQKIELSMTTGMRISNPIFHTICYRGNEILSY